MLCRRWLGNGRSDPEALFSPLVVWGMQQWQKQSHTLHLALDTTVLCNRFCVVVLFVVCHGRAIPLLWQTLCANTWIHGTAAPMSCEVRQLRLPRGHCRGFRDVQLKSGIFQLERFGLRDPARIDRLPLVVAIAGLISALQDYAVSLTGERRRVDPHWKGGLSFARIGLHCSTAPMVIA